MSINRQQIRLNFLKMRKEDELKLKEEEEDKKQEIKNEIIRQENESWLMRQEENDQRKDAFYKKLGINKLDMQIEFLFDMQDCGIFY